MKLYEINDQLNRLLELTDPEKMVDPETGEIFTLKDVDALNLAREEKIEGCLLYYKNMLADVNKIKEEAKVLNERAKILANKADAFKMYIKENLHGEKFETPRVKVSYRKSKSVEVKCKPEELPVKYQKVSVAADLTALKAAIESGEEIFGVSIKENQNIQIK